MYTKFELFTGHKLRFESTFVSYPLYTDIQQIWSYINIAITCLKELLVTFEIIRTHILQDIVSMRYVAARKPEPLKEKRQYI